MDIDGRKVYRISPDSMLNTLDGVRAVTVVDDEGESLIVSPLSRPGMLTRVSREHVIGYPAAA